MFPASTYKGGAVLSFPDVCKMPSSGVPVPIPYPNIGATAAGMKTGMKTKFATKTTLTTGTAYKRSSGDEAGALKANLNFLHGKIMGMPGGNTTSWHEAVDNYVMAVASVYISLSSK